MTLTKPELDRVTFAVRQVLDSSPSIGETEQAVVALIGLIASVSPEIVVENMARALVNASTELLIVALTLKECEKRGVDTDVLLETMQKVMKKQ